MEVFVRPPARADAAPLLRDGAQMEIVIHYSGFAAGDCHADADGLGAARARCLNIMKTPSANSQPITGTPVVPMLSARRQVHRSLSALRCYRYCRIHHTLLDQKNPAYRYS